jgi:hypothetical protein
MTATTAITTTTATGSTAADSTLQQQSAVNSMDGQRVPAKTVTKVFVNRLQQQLSAWRQDFVISLR